MARCGWMPAAAVYSPSFPMAIWIPPIPWSPMPRIPSESVTTTRSTFSGGSSKLSSDSSMRSGWSMDKNTPRVPTYSWLNLSMASPIVGV